MSIGVILNIVIGILLVVTIIYCFILSRRIANFNSSKNDLSKFLNEFGKSIAQAEKNIMELKEMGTQADENLKSQIKKAKFLANDLSFLTEKGENVAETLDSKITMSRDIYRKFAADSIIMQSPAVNIAKQQREDFYKMKAAPSSNNDHQSASKPSSNLNKKSVLDSLLKQIAQKKAEINSEI
ncbi:MAG TPA: hypothetical protein DIV86_05685 [Alphaproteobacteria bacterium]|mgnify:CR=1 FL=1|nr:hypothetical protein [Alphaproteobacteria bacterium]